MWYSMDKDGAEMTDYKSILLYYSKGNTNTQIATICGCSRTTVIKTIKRAKELNLKLPLPATLRDADLYLMLYPKRGKKQGYYVPDIHSIEKDRRKRSFSKYRAWQKYCRVAQREGYKAYSKSRFYSLYNEYGSMGARFHIKRSNNIGDILGFTILQSRYSNDAESYEFVQKQIDDWCKERRLDKYKIWNLRVSGF